MDNNTQNPKDKTSEREENQEDWSQKGGAASKPNPGQTEQNESQDQGEAMGFNKDQSPMGTDQ